MNSRDFRARTKSPLSISQIGKKRENWLSITVLDSVSIIFYFFFFLPNLREHKVARSNDGQRQSSFPDEMRDNVHPQAASSRRLILIVEERE